MSSAFERAERERRAYDEGDVDEVMATWHGRFPHVFECPNTLRHERLFDSATRAAVAGGRVVDVGCGPGCSSERLLELGAVHVLGIDISEREIAKAAGRAVPDRLEFQVADVTSHLEGMFDAVFGRSILHHIDYRPFLRRCYEHNVAPGGAMLFMEPLGSNPLIRLYGAIASAAHTSDERSFAEDDLRWLEQTFPDTEIRPINLLSFPAALATSRVARSADNTLLRACDRADTWLADRGPRLRSQFRQAMIAVRKPR